MSTIALAFLMTVAYGRRPTTPATALSWREVAVLTAYYVLLAAFIGNVARG